MFLVVQKSEGAKSEGAKRESSKSEGAVDHSTVTKQFKKFWLGCHKLDNYTRSDRSKIMDSDSILHEVEANPVNSTWIISGELVIFQSSLVQHLHNLSKSIWSCQIIPCITKILLNFWLTLVFVRFCCCKK